MRFHEFKEGLGGMLSAFDTIATALRDPGSVGNTDATRSSAGTDSSAGTPSSGGNVEIGKQVRNKVHPNDVANYLSSRGLDRNHVLGMLANIQGESNFDSGAVGDGNTSIGLFQHHADRMNNLVNSVGSDWATDWKGQIDFALSEPAGKEYVRTKFSSPEQATKWWVEHFEVQKNISSAVSTRIGMLKNFG